MDGFHWVSLKQFINLQMSQKQDKCRANTQSRSAFKHLIPCLEMRREPGSLGSTQAAYRPLQRPQAAPGRSAEPGPTSLGTGPSRAVKLGSHWIQCSRIQSEIQAVKKRIEREIKESLSSHLSSTDERDQSTAGKPKLRQDVVFPKFHPPERSGRSPVSTVSSKSSNPFRGLDVSTLSFDSESGLLFQLPLSQSAMVFTATELGTTLQTLASRPVGSNASLAVRPVRPPRPPIAFSLEPIDPWSWTQGTSPSGLYQQKWYSNEALQEIPLGYWMWRADWKLKQLAQGVVYDDATGQQRPLRCGIDVPHDYPDVAQGDAGCARLWIVCRKIIRQPWGRDGLLINPDNVQMGVEVRAQQFNKSTGKYEDAKDLPHTSASRVAHYLSQNYDAVARFVPELQHCKRMAVLLDVVHWLLEGPLASSRLVIDRCIPGYTIPSDFPADHVPALHTVHEKGLQEEERVKQLDQELERMKMHLKKGCAEKEAHINSLQAAAEAQMKRVEDAKTTLDQYSSKSVDACNSQVQKYNDIVEKRKASVQAYNAAVDAANKEINAKLAKRNAAAEACNAVRSRFAFIGGVDLTIDVEVEPIKCQSETLRQHVRQWADALWKESRPLLEPHPAKGLKQKISLPQELVDQKNAILSVFHLSEPCRAVTKKAFNVQQSPN